MLWRCPRCPRECAGPAAPLYPMLYFHFYAGGRAHIYSGVSAYYLRHSTTWGQGRQPSIAAAVSASASSAPVTSSSRDLREAARSCASCVPRRVVATTERWSLGAAGHPSSGGGGGGANVSRDASVATRPVTHPPASALTARNNQGPPRRVTKPGGWVTSRDKK